MIAADVLTHAEFVAMCARCVAAGNHDVHTLHIENLRRSVEKRLSLASNLSTPSTSLSERSRTMSSSTSSTVDTETTVASYASSLQLSEAFRPAVLTLSVFLREADRTGGGELVTEHDVLGGRLCGPNPWR